MKRIISFFVFILFGTILYSQSVNYIYNSKGDKVYFHTTHTLNLQNLVAGQYSVRLVSATGEVMDSKTLIVQ